MRPGLKEGTKISNPQNSPSIIPVTQNLDPPPPPPLPPHPQDELTLLNDDVAIDSHEG